MNQKVALLGIIVVGIGVGFYYGVIEGKQIMIEDLHQQVARIDNEIQGLSIKVKHLEELEAANKQLELELAKKTERLPPADEAVNLLKQLTELAVRLGLDIKLWKPNPPALDGSRLFARIPVSVEVYGGYHTAAIFFDRINKLQRIVNVSDLKMGSPRIEQNRIIIQSAFELTAFVAPPDMKPAGK